jgi:DNA-binding transcriptional LysR family regulator
MCTIGPSKLIDLFAAFRTHNEGVELYLKDASATALEELLAKGELDIAIYSKPEVPGDRFHVLPLYTERFVVAIAKDHALARLNAVNFKDLDGQIYLNRVNCEYFDYLKALREQSGANIRCPYRSERDDWIQSMVAAGLGFTFIPKFAVRHTAAGPARGHPHRQPRRCSRTSAFPRRRRVRTRGQALPVATEAAHAPGCTRCLDA